MFQVMLAELRILVLEKAPVESLLARIDAMASLVVHVDDAARQGATVRVNEVGDVVYCRG